MDTSLAPPMEQWEGREDYDKKAYCVQIKGQAKVLFQQIAGPTLEDVGEQHGDAYRRYAEIDLRA